MKAQRPSAKRKIVRMDSQPLDDVVEGDYSIEKKNDKKWKGVMNHAKRNKTPFTMTLSFSDVDGCVHDLPVVPSEDLLCSFYNCVDSEDEDQIITANSYYYKVKHNTEQLIQYRKARGDHIRVRGDDCVRKGFSIVFTNIKV